MIQPSTRPGTIPNPATIKAESVDPLFSDEYMLAIEHAFDNEWVIGARYVYRELSTQIDDIGINPATVAWALDNGYELDDVLGRSALRFLAPDRVRWDFATPDPMVILVADDTMTTFLPESGTAQRVKVSDNQSRLMGVFAGTQNLDDPIYGVLFDQALSGFPQPPQGQRSVRTEVMPDTGRPAPPPANPAPAAAPASRSR